MSLFSVFPLSFLPTDILQKILENIPYKDMIRLRTTGSIINRVYKERERLIYIHRLDQEYPQWPLLGDPKTHYQNIVMKNRWSTYYVTFLSEEGEILNSITSDDKDIVFDNYNTTIKIPGNPYPKDTVIYIITFDYDFVIGQEGIYLKTITSPRETEISFSIEEAYKKIMVRLRILYDKLKESEFDTEDSQCQYTYLLDRTIHTTVIHYDLSNILSLVRKLDGIVYQHMMIIFPGKDILDHDNEINIGLHKGTLPCVYYET